MRKLFLLCVIPALLAVPAPSAAGELKLTIQNGLVTLIADDVPLSAVMAEWARVGKTQIVNGDKVATPVTLQIIDTPERKALDILLRSVAGFMAAERPTLMAGASVFDRIMILPTSRPPANSRPIAPPPLFNRPVPVQPPVPDMDDDEPVLPPGMTSEPANMPQPGVPGQPQGALTAPRPGPLPQPVPQQPVPFGTPVKPGGGGRPGGGGGGQ